MSAKTVPINLIRKKIIELKDKDSVVTIGIVAKHLGLTKQDRQILAHRFNFLKRNGEIECISHGKYRCSSNQNAKPLGVLDKIWAVIRARRVVTYEDIMELADLRSLDTIKQYICKLKRHGYVRMISSQRMKPVFQLVKNVVERPKFNKKGNEIIHEDYE